MQMPYEDQHHEIFWQQLLQALVTRSSQRISLQADRSFYADQQTVEYHAPITVDATGRDALSISKNRWRERDPFLNNRQVFLEDHLIRVLLYDELTRELYVPLHVHVQL